MEQMSTTEITNGEIVADAAAAVEETSVTMLDVLEQEKELEEEYAAVLGASDEKCCTYTKGAIKRQALYSCLTCCPGARNQLDKCAGICLACSYKCHEHHELVELYTKRNFRCDCPTMEGLESGSNRCALNPTLKELQPPNVENRYNQNFQGLYCICHRPYPDPERTSEEVMLQCTVCEDWYHLQHLDVPPEYGKLVDNYNEMICGSCMQQHPFLQDYTGLALKALEEADANITVTGDVSISDDNKLKSDLDKSISDIMNISNEEEANEGNAASVKKDTNVEKNIVLANGETSVAGIKISSDEASVSSPVAKRQKLEVASENFESPSKKCRRPKANDYEKGATFWGNEWRNALCQCNTCMNLYKEAQIEYLLDAEDSAKSYEERGINRAATETSTYEQGIQALASIGRVQQIDAITEYNHMKDKLKEYLQTFALTKKVVTEEDINRFFEEMRNEKNANLGQPFFCR